MYISQIEEHLDFHYSSDSELDCKEAIDIGINCKERAWILTDRDVWHPNPFYTGPRRPHPESYEAEQAAYNDELTEKFEKEFCADDIPF